MSLFSRCIETYDAMDRFVGKPQAGMQTLAPIGHLITSANIEITVNNKGEFVRAREIDIKIPIPCTEESASRSSAPVSHPLSEQLGYVGSLEKKKEGLYLKALEQWAFSDYGSDILKAIYNYVKKGTVLSDLSESGINTKNEKDLVTWNMEGFGDDSGVIYENRKIMDSYIQYYSSMKKGRVDYCMVTGKNSILTTSHLKGVVSLNGNAKLISANDKSGFTFRGRLKDSNEANSISYEASQKAHNALKWIISNQGFFIGDRVCVCWNPSGVTLPKIDLPILFDFKNDEKIVPSKYKEALKNKIYGYKNLLSIDDAVMIAMFDAATTGRLAVTYYNELNASLFIEKLGQWDLDTCFMSSFYGTYSPRLKDCIDFAYGTYRGEYFETDPAIFKQHMQRILVCRINNTRIPNDIVQKIVENVSHLALYNNTTREKILHTACALIKKRNIEIGEEDYMALDKDYRDRSYQYGRLLAILEKIEKDTYNEGESRETNAIRAQTIYVQRPETTFAGLIEKLKQGYYPKLSVGAKKYYEQLISESLNIIWECGAEESNKPLTEKYIIGYYLQKQALYSKSK